jgi:uncharacterized protein (DUF1499 family)
MVLLGAFGVVCALSGSKMHQHSRPVTIQLHDPTMTRQDIFKAALLGALGFSLAPPQCASAFDNRVSDKYSDRPKQRGSQPKDLGVAKRKDPVGEEYLGLKHCGSAPNCFVSTDSADDDPDHSIPAWIWPKGYDKEKAFSELVSVVESYEPGQNNVDGGGFKIMTNDPKSYYLYVQFESLKNGYIDDVEFAMIDGFGEETAVQVRSSSRLGYLDFGVNAIRLNFIANKLRLKGWSAPGVSYDTHQNYAIQNGVV